MSSSNHWLQGSDFLHLFANAVRSVEAETVKQFAVDLVGRGETDYTKELIERLVARLEDVQSSPLIHNQADADGPRVSRFEVSFCDTNDKAKGDAFGADIAVLLKVNWPGEFVTERGILLQAKRLGRVPKRARGVVDPCGQIDWVALNNALGIPDSGNERVVYVLRPGLLGKEEDDLWGKFTVGKTQCQRLLQVPSSYYMFYDFPWPYSAVPCVQSLTVAGLGGSIRRSSIRRHAISFADLVIDQFLGCHVGEWNDEFEKLSRFAGETRQVAVEASDKQYSLWVVNRIVKIDLELEPAGRRMD